MSSQQKIQCGLCNREYRETRILSCLHVYCRQCCIFQHQQAGKPRPSQLSCAICNQLTDVPDGDVLHLPINHQNISNTTNPSSSPQDVVGAMAGLTVAHPSSSWSKSPTLVYHHKCNHVHGIAFLPDKSLAYIACDTVVVNEETKLAKQTGAALYALDPAGQLTELPFPAFLTSPSCVGSSGTGRTLVVADYLDHLVGGKRSLHTYSLVSGTWDCNTINTSKWVNTVAISPSGDVICDDYSNGANEVVRFSPTGQIRWTHPLPPTDTRYMLFLAIDHTDHLVISNPNTHQVTVLDHNGRQQAEFPKSFIKWPEGVAVTSDGDVLVVDRHTDIISLFTIDGKFRKKVLEVEEEAAHISLLDDSYLAVYCEEDGLYMYKL